jgi:cytoskeletal protein CcmA (bactofilin family)
MALWKEPLQKEQLAKENENADGNLAHPVVEFSPRSRERFNGKESLIASDLTVEGKIEGAGHVRIAGNFKGDIQVEGNLTIEPGAHLQGEVSAETIVVAGELQGNIHAAAQVELLETGLVIGDLKAGSLTVAAGSRMRGKAEFGWGEKTAEKLDLGKRDGSNL